jgi:hypothetical protein
MDSTQKKLKVQSNRDIGVYGDLEVLGLLLRQGNIDIGKSIDSLDILKG